MSREEFFGSLKGAVIVTLATIAGGQILTTLMLVITDFKDAWLHYTLATLFPLILAPAAAFPLLVMSHRLRAMKRELEGLLRLDSLTELPNRRAFFEAANTVFARGNPVSLMMIDVDRFKSVNDNYGHEVGDHVLRSVAKLIEAVVRQAGGTGEKLAARIGGEEFAVLVEGFDTEQAARLAEVVVTTIRQTPLRCDHRTLSVTVSVGVAQRRSGDSSGVVLRAADGACYRAKQRGRDQWRIADLAPAAPLELPPPRKVA